MSKKGVSAVSGNISPEVGEKQEYHIADWYPATPAPERKPENVTWELFRKRKSGKFTSTNIKKKADSSFTFGEASLGNTYRLEGYLHEPEGGGLIITPKQNKIPQISKVELFYIDDTKGSTFSFTEKLRARAYCTNMFNKEVVFTLWEDDVKGSGHNTNNKPIETLPPKKVDKNGVAVGEFMLTKALMKKAIEGEADPKQLEFYVTVEYYKNKKHATENVEINNPFPQVPKPQTKQTATPSKNIPKAKGSPAEQKPPSKKEEKGITDVVTELKGDLWDFAESIGKAIKDQLPTLPQSKGQSPAMVKGVVVEGILDAYFAKKEYTKQTGEASGTHEYPFGGNKANNQTSTAAQKEAVATKILSKVQESLKKDKKYTTKEAIVLALTANEYGKDTAAYKKVTLEVFKLGAELKKVANAALESKLYLVASTSGLNGKQVTLIIKEKDGLLKGAAGAVLPILEITEAQMEQASTSGVVPGTEKSQFTATIENGIAKVPVHLRPKSDDDLKIWKDKLKKGKQDGEYTYTFSNVNGTIINAGNKKSLSGIIAKNAKEGKMGNPKIEDGKVAYAEDIEAILEIKTYAKGETIKFKLYKKEKELLYIQAKAQGVKQHDKEFLKADGAYFEIGKKCECEERIRAFLRTLRLGEGTGEIIKAKDKVTKETIYVPHDFEKGYTTGFGGNLITDLSDHPRINYGGSTAAGAYQVMKDTWDDAQYSAKKTQYNIDSFSKENQDKFSVLLMKHHPGCSDLLSILLSGQTENSIRGRGSRIWASLPEKGDNSRYLFKGNPQPVTPMKTVLEHYEKFLKEELAGNSPLYLKKGFLKDFDIKCNCGNDSVGSSDWHHPLDRMELRGWYTETQWSPGKSDFHGRTGGAHDGLDLYAPVGTTIYACIDGEITYMEDKGGYGHRTFLEGTYNGQTYFLMYCHLSEYITGQVKAGDPIGKTGQTGNASGQAAKMDHLHFEVRKVKMTKPSFDPLTEISELGRDVITNPDSKTQTGQ